MRFVPFKKAAAISAFSAALLMPLATAVHAEESPVQNGIESLPSEERISLSARWDLGYYLFQMQDYSGAAIEFEKIRRVLPGEATLLALIGSCYSMSGRWDEGENALLQALAQNPTDADVNGLLGQFYLTAGKAMKGAFYFEKALKEAPELSDMRVRLIDVYLESDQYAQARVHLDLLLKDRGGEDFGDPNLEHAYARCLVQAGHYRQGLPFALRAYQAQPANPAFARILGLCYMGANRYADAAQMLALSQSWGGADLQLQLGEALFQDRRWDEAEAVWLKGIRRFPGSYTLLSRLMEYYLGLARPDEASKVIAYAADHNPGNPGNLLLEVRLHRKLAGFATARKAVERLKRQACGPMLQEALWEEAQIDYETGRFSSCGRLLDRLLTSSDRRADAHLLKARLALKQGDLASAQTHVLEAKDVNPYNLKVYALAKEAFSRPQDGGTLSLVMEDGLALMPGSDFLFAQVAGATHR